MNDAKERLVTRLYAAHHYLKLAVNGPYNRPFDRLVKRGTTGCEIGVYKGNHALALLKRGVSKLYLVDPYNYGEDFPYQANAETMTIAEKRVSKFKNNVQFVRRHSDQAANFVPNELDFVYIDGDHSPSAVAADCELWYPKVKFGGIIGGHDINLPSVATAVSRFVTKYNQ